MIKDKPWTPDNQVQILALSPCRLEQVTYLLCTPVSLSRKGK